MNPKPSKNPKFSLEKTVSLFQKPLLPQLQSWLREVEQKAKSLKTGKITIKIDFFED